MSHDTLLHRLVRPAVRPLARTSVTPNQITTARLVLGLAAALCFAAGGWSATALGGAVFLVSLLLDRADGELARLSGKISKRGYRFDLMSDCIADVAAFLGLGIGQRSVLGPWAMALGVVAGVSVMALFYQLNVARPSSPARLSNRSRPFADADDALIALPLLVWLGLAPQALILAAVLTPLAAAGVYLNSRLQRTG